MDDDESVTRKHSTFRPGIAGGVRCTQSVEDSHTYLPWHFSSMFWWQLNFRVKKKYQQSDEYVNYGLAVAKRILNVNIYCLVRIASHVMLSLSLFSFSSFNYVASSLRRKMASMWPWKGNFT